MSREEAIEVIQKFIGWFKSDSRIYKALKMAIQALEQNESAEEWYKLFVEKLDEQEPCDKCVYSTKDGYCQYDDISETIPPLEPCEDAVSREAVLSKKIYTETEEGWSGYTVNADYIEQLPSVTQKSGKWLYKEITDDYRVTGQCSECKERRIIDNFCPNCGARMVEPQESEDKE